MEILKGKSILKGVAIGRIKFYSKEKAEIRYIVDADPEAEKERFEAARLQAQEQLAALYEKALAEVGEANAEIFEIHQMMLDDDDFLDAVNGMIDSEHVNAEYAVSVTGKNFAEMFASMEDNEYMQGRAADIQDISERLVQCLTGASGSGADSDEPFILMAEDLAPSETVQLDKSKLLGFVTRLGSAQSHTAILARTMNIPALIGTEDISKDMDGKMAIIDGYNDMLYLDPTEELLTAMEAKRQADLEQLALLDQLKGQEDVTLDGRKIHLYANIGNVADVANVLTNDADGIGLFRSEFLYLEGSDFPTEEEQFQAYKKVAATMGGKKVIIRTLDIGADKQADYFNLPKEENPALGYRAIRICLTQKDIFKTQLRALLRASAFGNISIMFPMIISVWEVQEAKAVLQECMKELDDAQVAYNKNIEVGIMIETPASVMLSRELAEEVDFFSIGTNDLTQYCLAIDRQNPKLGKFFNPHHPALMKMLQMTVDNGHAGGCWVGICGELGADPELTETFLRMGFDELSVSPVRVLPIRKIIRGLDLSK